MNTPQDIDNDCLVAFLSSPNEVDVAYVERSPSILESGAYLVDKFLSPAARRLRSLIDFLTVFIGTCKEKNLISLKSFKACDNVCSYGRIGVTNVWNIVHIINRSSNVKLFFCHVPIFRLQEI